MRRIAIVGPESSGKTTLAGMLVRHLGAAHVDEAARDYLSSLGRPYVEVDLLRIAHAQAAAEDAMASASPHLLLCDTDLITIRIWSEEKYGRCHPWILGQSEKRHYDLWLLCRPDIPWAPDPLRENPNDRDRLFDVYEGLLRRLAKPFRIIEGSAQERLRGALEAIAGLEPSAQRQP